MYAHHTSSSSSGVSTGTSSASSASASSNSYASHSQTNAVVPHAHASHASSGAAGSQTHSPAGQTGTQPSGGDADKPIGYGAFGVVWAVTDPRDGKRVALKKLPNAFHNMTASRRVYRELMMLCTLKHENVVCANDILQPTAYETFSEIYVLTELMQTDLHRIIVSPQPLTADHVKVFLYQLLRGAKFLHSARIIHRDIKPGNLLVNSNCLLKVSQFAVSR